jgi:hypothetical protein
MELSERQDEIILASSKAQRFGVDYFLTVLNLEEDPLCRWYALQALGSMRASKAKEQLLRVLRQPDVEFDESTLHRICAWAIGRIGFELTDDGIAFLEGSNTTEAKIAAQVVEPAN